MYVRHAAREVDERAYLPWGTYATQAASRKRMRPRQQEAHDYVRLTSDSRSWVLRVRGSCARRETRRRFPTRSHDFVVADVPISRKGQATIIIGIAFSLFFLPRLVAFDFRQVIVDNV